MMARFLQFHAAAAAASRNSQLKPFIRPHRQQSWIFPTKPIISRRQLCRGIHKSPFGAAILRLLRTAMDFHRQYAPSHQVTISLRLNPSALLSFSGFFQFLQDSPFTREFSLFCK